MRTAAIALLAVVLAQEAELDDDRAAGLTTRLRVALD
jgi:hypothetical protein